MAPKLTLDEAKDALRIEGDDIDRMLIEHPQLFHYVADAYELAVDRRDALKLELDELLATTDEDVRAEAHASGERMTESAISNRVRSAPEIQRLYRKHLSAKTEAARWGALKAAFEQRSHALRHIVDRATAQLFSQGVQRGTGALRARRADETRDRMAEARRERYG